MEGQRSTASVYQIDFMHWDTFKQDNYSTVGGDGRWRVAKYGISISNRFQFITTYHIKNTVLGASICTWMCASIQI